MRVKRVASVKTLMMTTQRRSSVYSEILALRYSKGQRLTALNARLAKCYSKSIYSHQILTKRFGTTMARISLVATSGDLGGIGTGLASFKEMAATKRTSSGRRVTEIHASRARSRAPSRQWLLIPIRQ